MGTVPAALFAAHGPMFLLAEPDGAPHVRVVPGRRLLPVFVSRADLDAYFAVWGPGLALSPGAPEDGAAVLAMRRRWCRSGSGAPRRCNPGPVPAVTARSISASQSLTARAPHLGVPMARRTRILLLSSLLGLGACFSSGNRSRGDSVWQVSPQVSS